MKWNEIRHVHPLGRTVLGWYNAKYDSDYKTDAARDGESAITSKTKTS